MDGTWDDEDPACQRPFCSPLPIPLLLRPTNLATRGEEEEEIRYANNEGRKERRKRSLVVRPSPSRQQSKSSAM